MRCVGLFLAITCALPAFSQAPAVPRPPAQVEVPQRATTLRTGTHLVTVDVIVMGKDHHPVRHLKASDFTLLEDKVSQTFKSFEEHSSEDVDAKKIDPLPAMPVGVFTNYTPTPANGPINVLLIDRLNTPQIDQMRLNQQILQFLDTLKPGTRLAIFGMTTHLTLLQGFTGNPEYLKAAIHGNNGTTVGTLHPDASGGESPMPTVADAIASNDILAQSEETYANAIEFEAAFNNSQTMERARYTLDCMNALARYLGSMPGRKNLIWFSGSFPMEMYDDPLHDQDTRRTDSVVDNFHRTASLLSQSQVAVYPIDARGIANLDINDIAHKDLTALNAGPILSARFHTMTVELNSVVEEHHTMLQTAYETGGRAFIATNDLTRAVEDAIDDGSNYYTLTYTPYNGDWDGQYRKIQVLTHLGSVTLSYRRGYFAVDSDPTSPRHLVEPFLAGVGVSGPNAMRAALQRGTPEATQLTITARVLPLGNKSEEVLARGNYPPKPLKTPYRRYAIDAVVNPLSLHLPIETDGRRHGAFEFIAFLYDEWGALLNSVDSTVRTSFKPETYTTAVRIGIPIHQQISVPATGKYFLRLAVHDFANDRVGAIEIPLDAVATLPPLELAADPAADALLPSAHRAIPMQSDDPMRNNVILPGAATQTP